MHVSERDNMFGSGVKWEAKSVHSPDLLDLPAQKAWAGCARHRHILVDVPSCSLRFVDSEVVHYQQVLVGVGVPAAQAEQCRNTLQERINDAESIVLFITLRTPRSSCYEELLDALDAQTTLSITVGENWNRVRRVDVGNDVAVLEKGVAHVAGRCSAKRYPQPA
jgi:hypothetical protein